MIFISAGHHPAKPGACYDGFCEYDVATRWADKVVQLLGSYLAIRVPDGTLRDKVKFINDRSPRLAVEIHFNSAHAWVDKDKDGVVSDDELRHVGRGCETLYYPGSLPGLAAAKVVQAHLAAVFSPDRGVKEGWYRMNPKFGPDFYLAQTTCPALIVEPEFIHRRQIILDNEDAGCEALAAGLDSAFREITK